MKQLLGALGIGVNVSSVLIAICTFGILYVLQDRQLARDFVSVISSACWPVAHHRAVYRILYFPLL